MENYKQEFIEFMVESDVLKFGDFTLKSGRKSPFFMNAGAYVTGSQLHRLGQYMVIRYGFGVGSSYRYLLKDTSGAEMRGTMDRDGRYVYEHQQIYAEIHRSSE